MESIEQVSKEIVAFVQNNLGNTQKCFDFVMEEIDKHFVVKSQAWFTALKEEVETLTGDKINEEEFIFFLDKETYRISDNLEKIWKEWRNER